MEQAWELAYAYTQLNDAYPDTTYQYYLDNLRPFVDYHREVEAKYADDAKAEMIRRQEAQLKQRRREQLQLLLIVALIGSGALLLVYFNRRLGRVNRTLAVQSSILEQTNQELEASLKHQELLQSELHHRVKNNLQVIISMLELQQWNTDSPGAKNSLHAMSERIYSLAAPALDSDIPALPRRGILPHLPG